MREDPARANSSAPLSREQKLELYYYMRLTRSLEERLVNLYRQTKVVGGLFRSLGQEADAVGSAYARLDAPVLRVTAADVPLPYSPPLEDYVLPQTSDIVMALRKLAAY